MGDTEITFEMVPTFVQLDLSAKARTGWFKWSIHLSSSLNTAGVILPYSMGTGHCRIGILRAGRAEIIETEDTKRLCPEIIRKEQDGPNIFAIRCPSGPQFDFMHLEIEETIPLKLQIDAVEVKSMRMLFPSYSLRTPFMVVAVEPRIPDLMKILDSCLLDAEVGMRSFENFCAESGYDSDSMPCLRAWESCNETFRKVMSLCGHSLQMMGAIGGEISKWRYL